MSQLEYREGVYGERVLAVEPGGAEAVPDGDRHGKAWNLFAVWASPNLEFATIYVGALALFFGLSFWQAVVGIVIGNGLGALTHYVLTQDGPKYGVPQMVIGRTAFGRVGNVFPALTNALAAGWGWFAVNSASGAFALNAATHWNTLACLSIVAVAQIAVAVVGHNLVQKVERYLMPYLVVVFGVAAVIVFTKGHYGGVSKPFFPGAFIVFTAAVYGYAAGWNPFASDYSRYLPKDTNPRKAGLAAALGMFSAASILQLVGAAAVTAGMRNYGKDTNPVADFTSFLPHWFSYFVLYGIALGSICANVLNIYSGAISFDAIGLRLKAHWLRAFTALVFGVIGFFIAHWAMANPANNLENFLLVMSYWIGPWLGAVAADKLLRRGSSIQGVLYADRENPAGVIAFVVSTILAIWLFANQKYYVGYFPKHNGNLGDVAFIAGFIISFFIYIILRPMIGDRTTEQ